MTTTATIRRLVARYTAARDTMRAARAASQAVTDRLGIDASESDYAAARVAAGLMSAREEGELFDAFVASRRDLARAARALCADAARLTDEQIAETAAAWA